MFIIFISFLLFLKIVKGTERTRNVIKNTEKAEPTTSTDEINSMAQNMTGLKYIIIFLLLPHFGSTFEISTEKLKNGIMSETENIVLYISFENVERINIIANYNFDPPQFDENILFSRSTLRSSHCTKTLSTFGKNQFDSIRMINITINQIFEQSKNIFPELTQRRTPRQVFAAIVGGTFGYLAHSLLSNFLGKTHEIRNDYISKKLTDFLCYIKHTEATEDKIILELVAKRVVNE